MTPTQTGDKPMVTQADRDLVYSLMLPAAKTALERKALEYIRAGRGDDAEAVIAVARHRAQETLSPEQPDERPCLHCNGTDPHCSVCEGVGTLPVFCEPLDTIQRLGQEFDGPEASPSLGMGEALRIARETIQIERDHLVSCCTLNGDRDTLEEGAKPDVERMEYALAAIDAALSPSPDLAEENERLREYLADCVAQDVATRIEREFQGFWAKEDLIEEIPGLIREAILARSTIQTISTGNP